MASALVIQHLTQEGPGVIADALTRAGVELKVVRVFEGDQVPVDVLGIDGLVVMGGSMSVLSDDNYPTRLAELDLMRRALAADIPILGVCLGAQLLAVSAGGAVVAGAAPEIGWGPVRLNAAASYDPLLSALSNDPTVLHWHGEQCILPPEGELLASTEVCPIQAFRVGLNAWGFQFHLEVDPADVQGFVHSFPKDAAAAAGGAEKILADTPRCVAALQDQRNAVLDRFAQLVAAGR